MASWNPASCDSVYAVRSIDPTVGVNSVSGKELVAKPQFTFELWVWCEMEVHPTSSIEYETVCHFFTYGGNEYRDFYINISVAKQGYETQWSYVYFAIGNTGGGQVSKTVYINYNDFYQKWVHLAITFDGTVGKLYINGTYAGQTSTFSGTRPDGETGKLYLFNFPAGSGGFVGVADDMRHWDYARTQAQIDTYKTQRVAFDESGLVAYWRMEEGSGDTIGDGCAGGYDLNMSSSLGDFEWVVVGTVPSEEEDRPPERRRRASVVVPGVMAQVATISGDRQRIAKTVAPPFSRISGLQPGLNTRNRR